METYPQPCVYHSINNRFRGNLVTHNKNCTNLKNEIVAFGKTNLRNCPMILATCKILGRIKVPWEFKKEVQFDVCKNLCVTNTQLINFCIS